MRTLLLFLLLTFPLLADEPQTVKLTLSPETTYLTEPQLPDGRIDYLAALNTKLSAKTTPENNLLVGLLALIPSEMEAGIVRNPQGNSKETRKLFAAMIGCKTLPPLESLQDIDPVGYLSTYTGDYFEKELLTVYSKEEVDRLIQAERDKVKQQLKESFDEGKITKEKYDTESKIADADREKYCGDVMSNQFLQAQRNLWTAEDYPYLAKWLATTDNLAAKLIALSKERTGYYHPQISESGLFYDMLLPYMPALRSCARYFQARGNFEFARGNYDEAMECAFASIRLGQTLRKESCWIFEALYGNAMIVTGDYQLTMYLAALAKKKDAAWIMQKKKEFDALARETELGQDVPMWCLHERLAILNCTQAIAVNHPTVVNEYFKRLFSDDEVFAQYEKLFRADKEYNWDEILRQINLFYDDMDDVCLLPEWQRRLRASDRLDQRVREYDKRSKNSKEKPEQQAVDFMIGNLAPSFDAMLQALSRLDWSHRIVSLSFALAAYRADNGGECPDSLAQLVPKYLESVPLSPHTGKPMRYIKRQKDVLMTNDDFYKLDGSEEEVEQRIAEAKSGEWVYPVIKHHVFVVEK
jgi:hypothetical protein